MTTKACVNVSAIFLAGILAVACGSGAERSVRAINLQNGQQQDFESEEAVPPGWGICGDTDCSIPPGVPCQNLGEAVCRATAGCELVELGCVAEGCAISSDGTTDPNCKPSEPVCEYACMPAGTITCEQITDQAKCTSKPECSWDMLACAMACSQDYCPPCPAAGICRTVKPDSCDNLDATRCLARPDCEWEPLACPAIACAPDQPDCAIDCPAFCRPKKPTACTAIGIPVPACENGRAVPRFDDAGCLVGYDCIDDCPLYDLMVPNCNGVPPIPVLDERGCAVGFKCPTECPDHTMEVPNCDNGLPLPQYDENGCFTGYTCEPCPAIPMMYPHCGDNIEAVPGYNDKGCLTGYTCPND